MSQPAAPPHAAQPAGGFTPPPAAGPFDGFALTKDDTTYAMLAHALTFIEGGLIGPLVLYIVKKDSSPFVAFHALQSFYFGLLLLLVSVFTCGIGFFLFVIPYFVFEVIALKEANEGRWYRLPIVGEWAWKKHSPAPGAPGELPVVLAGDHDDGLVVATLVLYPRLLQGWSMFAPDAPLTDGTLVVDGITEDGRHIDPFTGAAPDFDAPFHGPWYIGQLRCDYWLKIHFDGNAGYREELKKYLERWQQLEGRPRQDRPVSFTVYWVENDAPPPGSTTITNVRRTAILSSAPSARAVAGGR